MTSGRSPYAHESDTPGHGLPAHGARAAYGTWPPGPDLGPPTPSGWSPAPIETVARIGVRHRAQWLSWTVLLLAVVVSAVLGICTYAGLAAVRVAAPDPWGAAWTWLAPGAAAALAAVVVVVLGVVALLVSRPKRVAGLATLVALVLPFVALGLAVAFAVAAAVQHGALGGATLDRLGSAGGPVGGVLEWLVGLVAGRG